MSVADIILTATDISIIAIDIGSYSNTITAVITIAVMTVIIIIIL